MPRGYRIPRQLFFLQSGVDLDLDKYNEVSAFQGDIDPVPFRAQGVNLRRGSL